MTIDEAQAAVEAARKVLAEIDNRRTAELRKAEAEINARFKSERQDAMMAIQGAERDLRDAKDQTPDHPWTGKRVYKMDRVGSTWNRRDKRVDGVVETRRSSTQFPANSASYRIPQIGDGFVRLLKSDGTPGTKFESLGSYHGWKLVEGEA